MVAALALAILILLFRITLQQQDPLQDFCRRFGHQTALIDNRLFIDGGLINFNPLAQNPLNYTNTGLLYADLTVDNSGEPMEFDNLTKPASAPDVQGGVLWADTVNKYLYLYGGEYYQSSPEGFSFWQYDAIYDNWTTVTPDVSQAGIDRASFGAGLVQEDTAKAFWYGGWLSNASVPAWSDQPMALSFLLEYDLIKNTWTNMTGPDSTGRAEGVMVYIPASDGGMLVYFGGLQDPLGNGTYVPQPMDEIIIYDIANQRWYTQTASGNVPQDRRRFCAGVTWAQDQSSYNIYLYGGFSVPTQGGPGFDDVYILSLPTFTWIKWWPTELNGTAYPHHSLTCNVIAGAQMLIQGGTFPNSTQCDVPQEFGIHNLDLGKQNPDDAMWYVFRPNITTYQVPSEIVSVIGGDATGGATNRAPSGGWDDRDLAVYFTRIYQPVSRAATRSIPTPPSTTANPSYTGSGNSSSVPIGAIVGAAVGGGFFLLACVAGGIFLCVSFRKKKAENSPGAQQQTPMIGLPFDFQPSATPLAQLPDGRPMVELSSPESEAAAAKLPRYSAFTSAPAAQGSPPPVPAPPLYTPGAIHPGMQAHTHGTPPPQQPYQFPLPHEYPPAREYFSPTAQSPSTTHLEHTRTASNESYHGISTP